MSARNKARLVLFPMISALIGIVIALFILEGALRFLPVFSGLTYANTIDEEPTLRFVANREFTYSRGWNFRGVNIGHTNNFGFVNNQDYDPAAVSPLVAVIGDSYIEAAMVPSSKTVHARLAELAQGRGRVYSFGMSGASLSQYLAWAIWVKKTFCPDLLIVTIVGNDFDESLLRYKDAPGFHYFDDSKESMPLVRVDLGQGLLDKAIRLSYSSSLSQYTRKNLGLSAIVQRFRSPNVVNYVGNVPASVETERVERSKDAADTFLVRLPQVTAIPANRIILVVDGMRTNLYSEEGLRNAQGTYFDLMRRYFIKQAAERKYTVVDMQPRLIERHRATGELFEYPDDGHWNEAGHAAVAEAVREAPAFRDLFGSHGRTRQTSASTHNACPARITR